MDNVQEPSNGGTHIIYKLYEDGIAKSASLTKLQKMYSRKLLPIDLLPVDDFKNRNDEVPNGVTQRNNDTNLAGGNNANCLPTYGSEYVVTGVGAVCVQVLGSLGLQRALWGLGS
jgi:hypothetical protein